MNHVTKIGDIVSIEGGEQFLVIDSLYHSENSYLLLGNVIKSEGDEFRTAYARELFSKNGDYYLELVTDSKLISALNDTIKSVRTEN